MESAFEELAFAHHGAEEAAAMLDDLIDTYADAYSVPPGEKTVAFAGRARGAFGLDGFDLVAARTLEGVLIAFVFGYSLADAGWWVGLDPEPPTGFTYETGTRTVVLSEIEVRRDWQRKGLGRVLHAEFLRRRTEERATLATGADVASRHVYQRWGWQNVGAVPGQLGAYFPSYHLFVKPLDG